MDIKPLLVILSFALPFAAQAEDEELLLDEEETLELIEDDDALSLDEDSDSMELSNDMLIADTIDSQNEDDSPFTFEGSVGIEYRRFYQKGAAPTQDYHNNFSFKIEPTWRYEWDDGSQNIVFTPFARVDDQDEERTHFDIRELLWTKFTGDWTIRAGVGKVFWGVTESQHLVDIINQTDFVENINGEEKLGQSMLNLAYTADYGTFDLFVLPGFRERTFPGEDGRLRLIPQVDNDHALYESGAGDDHIDFAVRWAQTIGDWDIGLAHFHGTTRDPQYVPVFNGVGAPPVKLLAYYEIIDQTSIDTQAVKGNWLWKLEAYSRGGQGSGRFEAAATGFEYTFSGVFETGADLGLLAEYLYDNRDISELTTPFDDDIYLGTRFGFNDTQSTELLIGFIMDRRNNSEWTYSVEGSRRIAEDWKISLEARGFGSAGPEYPISHSVRKDDYIMFELERFF
ncbi:MAG: hypothetical protein DRQ61_03805 [Gammaproteobacteria bacterium]|nr:MAG: hypothetical protein DRQ61_03805 [Gammaproteobacteria bacterium]